MEQFVSFSLLRVKPQIQMYFDLTLCFASLLLISAYFCNRCISILDEKHSNLLKIHRIRVVLCCVEISFTCFCPLLSLITWTIFICFTMKANQITLHIFMTMDQAAQMGIWPCSASQRIHLLVCFPCCFQNDYHCCS